MPTTTSSLEAQLQKAANTATVSLDAIIKATLETTSLDAQIEVIGNTSTLVLDARIIRTFEETNLSALLNKTQTGTLSMDAIVLRGKTCVMDAMLVDTNRQHRSVAVGVRPSAFRNAIFGQEA